MSWLVCYLQELQLLLAQEVHPDELEEVNVPLLLKLTADISFSTLALSQYLQVTGESIPKTRSSKSLPQFKQ
jgi:hypothetical protein